MNSNDLRKVQVAPGTGPFMFKKIGVPGLGNYLVQALSRRDRMVIQHLVLIDGIIFVVINLIVDFSYAWIDPRIRYQ